MIALVISMAGASHFLTLWPGVLFPRNRGADSLPGGGFFYTGPLARAIGGIDLSWLVGIAVVSPVYYFTVRLVKRPQPVASTPG